LAVLYFSQKKHFRAISDLKMILGVNEKDINARFFPAKAA